jgi:hypothetical protein
MSASTGQDGSQGSSRFSVDVWAVLLALVLAALVRAGVLKAVPW